MLNAARMRLQVYDENELSPVQELHPQSFELPIVMQAVNQVNPENQHPYPLRVGAPRFVLQDGSVAL